MKLLFQGSVETANFGCSQIPIQPLRPRIFVIQRGVEEYFWMQKVKTAPLAVEPFSFASIQFMKVPEEIENFERT